MSHLHNVTDGDMHFSIDPITRTIKNNSDKTTIIQNDHNSERFTFVIPKVIDGHDMTTCNAVQVHYLNIDNATRTQSAGVYEVDDLTIGKNAETVEFTWLLSCNATQYVGGLNFVIRFSCVSDDGTVEYAWHTAVFSGITIQSGILNTETIAEENIDILEQWKAEILAQAGTGGTGKPLKEWKAGTEYKKGDMCISEKLFKGYPKTILMICKQNHISSGEDEPDNLNVYWDYYTILARNSVADAENNVIHETYATKDDLGKSFYIYDENDDFAYSKFSDEGVYIRRGVDCYELTSNGFKTISHYGETFQITNNGVSGDDSFKTSWQEWLGIQSMIDAAIGEIETDLDNIISIQNQLIGGDGE